MGLRTVRDGRASARACGHKGARKRETSALVREPVTAMGHKDAHKRETGVHARMLMAAP